MSNHEGHRPTFHERLSSGLGLLLGLVVNLLMAAVFILVFGSNLWSCLTSTFGVGNRRGAGEPAPELVEADLQRNAHAVIYDSLVGMWDALHAGEQPPRLIMAQSAEINAASFGDGRFLVWEGVGELPVWAIDSIIAHEVAHDSLLHSRKASELADLMDFLAELVGLAGATAEGEKTLKDFMRNAALPKYSRSQEYAADAEALELLKAIGYQAPATAMRDTMKILLDRYGNTGGGFLDSHPSTRERMEVLGAARQ